MIVITEEQAKALVSMADAIEAVDAVFRAMADGSARNFPVVREMIEAVGGTYGVKSAVDVSAGVVGLKTGGYWPGNAARGLKNHQSTTLVCDAWTGEARAVVAANYLTAIRTAAASAVATRALARPDVETLSVIGAGAQVLPQIEAQCAVRRFTRILVGARDPSKAAAAAEAAQAFAPEAAATTIENAAREADVLVTVTPAKAPIILANWVKAGTHVNAVGSDTRGKQEIEANLLQQAQVFVDEWAQASTIGECQHLAEAAGAANVATIGDVLLGKAPGRRDKAALTVFDSTGVALQDLAVARMALGRLAR